MIQKNRILLLILGTILVSAEAHAEINFTCNMAIQYQHNTPYKDCEDDIRLSVPDGSGWKYQAFKSSLCPEVAVGIVGNTAPNHGIDFALGAPNPADTNAPNYPIEEIAAGMTSSDTEYGPGMAGIIIFGGMIDGAKPGQKYKAFAVCFLEKGATSVTERRITFEKIKDRFSRR